MSADWQISAGHLSEFLRPAAFALAALASALVLADARRRLGASAVAAWALFTLLLPHVALPLYVAARMFSGRPGEAESGRSEATPGAVELGEPEISSARVRTAGAAAGGAQATEGGRRAAGVEPAAEAGRLRWRFTLPLLYAALISAVGALWFYLDYRSADAHLSRAEAAKLFGGRERAVREYRAALALDDDAHTRKLLGVELYKAGRLEEALAELRAAQKRGEPDEALAFHIASTLVALNRQADAAAEYIKFLQSRLCTQPLPDPRCAEALVRLESSTDAVNR